MAASKPSDSPWGELPPESTEFGFPLYLNLTEYIADTDEWWRYDDDVSSALYQWCQDNLVGDSSEGYVPITEDTKIYINGGLVDEIIMDLGTYYIYGASLPFAEVGFYGYELFGIGAKFPIQTTLQFPLYIYFDECEELWGGKECIINGDFSELARYLNECAIAYGEKESTVGENYLHRLEGDGLSKIGKIYIEDQPLVQVIVYSIYDLYAEYSTEDYSGQITMNHVNGNSLR